MSSLPTLAACSVCGHRWPVLVLDNFGRCPLCCFHADEVVVMQRPRYTDVMSNAPTIRRQGVKVFTLTVGDEVFADLPFGTATEAARLFAKGARSDALDVIYGGPEYVEGPCCSICDGLGHGYPGGGPCPLEDRGWNDDPRGD